MRRALATSALVGLVGGTFLLAAPTGAQTDSVTFDEPGSTTDFVVPAGVCELVVDAFGAAGGIGAGGGPEHEAGRGGHRG